MLSKSSWREVSLACALVAAISACGKTAENPGRQLPAPRMKGEVSVEEAISRRRSRRTYADEPLALEQISQLLWCAQGITGPRGRKRASPSAGATYPMQVYLVVGRDGVEGLQAGVYLYHPEGHRLQHIIEEDVQQELAAAALDQDFIHAAPVDIVLAADYSRTTRRYGQRGRRYVHMEAGHTGQNLYLQAEAAGLATVTVGAFRDEEVARVCGLRDGLEPLYILPVGKARQQERN